MQTHYDEHSGPGDRLTGAEHHPPPGCTFADMVAHGPTGQGLMLVWSNEHAAWWRASAGGYTKTLAEAGLYGREDAIAICVQALGGFRPGGPLPEVPVRYDDMAFVALKDRAFLNALGCNEQTAPTRELVS